MSQDEMWFYLTAEALPFAIIQLILSLSIVWLMYLNMRLMNNIVTKDDPFPNGLSICLLIIFVGT